MKTKGLTFQQALKALNEDKCIGIRPESFMTNDYYKETDGGHLAYFIPRTNAFILKSSLSLSILLGKWDLVIDAVSTPKTEQKVFNYWIVIWPNGTVETYSSKPSKFTYKEAQHVFDLHQEYIYTYPKVRIDNAKIP